MMKMVLFLLAASLLLPMFSRAIDVLKLRHLASEYNVTCILVFGDSSVDPGNNNGLATTAKSNYAPYGKNFVHGQPTGRFSNGRLAPDFIADALGYTKLIPAFLDPKLKNGDLVHGVSFASAASGYDDLTANLSNVLPFSKQINYLLHYKIQLRKAMGEEAACKIINNAIFLISMGTNDFLQNYYIEPTRPGEFTVEKYQDFLIARLRRDIKVLHRIGATRVAIVGVPALGCMPLVKTIMNEETKCVDSFNQIALSFNVKIQEMLANLNESLKIKYAYADIYHTIMRVMENPSKFGMTETSKGCVGTGTFEYGDTCKDLSTCADPDKYVFWDAVHLTEKMYQIIANEALVALNENLLR